MPIPKTRLLEAEITQDYVRKLFWHSPYTGRLFRRRNAGTQHRLFLPLGSNNGRGYLHIKIRSTIFLLHRIVWLYHHGNWPRQTIDHIDRNRSNNRIDNLQDISISENLRNGRSWGVLPNWPNVTERGSRFEARVTYRRKQHYLGLFLSPRAAHAAARRFKIANGIPYYPPKGKSDV